MKRQVIIPFLPGYMFDGHQLVSTGAALYPTQHINEKTGEVVYYVKPLFDCGPSVGMFIRHNGLVDWLEKQTNHSISMPSSSSSSSSIP